MGCTVAGSCGKFLCNKGPEALNETKLIPGAVYAPWAEVTIGGRTITVGNQSFPPGNTAVIKSLEYGGSNGNGCTIEIIDEEGGAMAQAFLQINHDICNSDYKMQLDFGWIVEYCEGAGKEIDKASEYGHGGKLNFIIAKMEAVFEEGVIKFTIHGRDLVDVVAQNRTNEAQGQDDQQMQLKDAVEDHLKDNCPHIGDVRWVRVEDNDWVEFGFPNTAGRRGPSATWPADGQSALADTRKWLNTQTTDKNKGTLMVWDCQLTPPTIICLEDPLEAPGEDHSCENNVGTFIVNGGDCSPVISFTPKAEWAWGANSHSGGAPTGSVASNNPEAEGRRGANRDEGGIQQAISVPQFIPQFMPLDDAGVDLRDNLAANEDAARTVEGISTINAQLRIVGNPRFAPPFEWLGKFVSIIVINPFHIKGGGGGCGDWLAQPPCNPVYSNKGWFIRGVSHSIREGSYTTTIDVVLPAPGTDLDKGDDLGDDGDAITFS